MAVRIEGVNLPNEKRIEIGLTYIFGVGPSKAKKVLQEAAISPDVRVKDLTEAEIAKLRSAIEGKIKVEGDLRREVSQNVRRLKEIGSYRGNRHSAGLPVHGQRTKTNARTKRGKKINVGSGKKKSAAKT
jgi:small subunit ribosomal protein S13